MKKIVHLSLLFLSYIVLTGTLLMGIFTAMGVCAQIWGGDILRTAMGDPPDRSHPAFWVGLFVMIIGMLLASFGGIPVCKLIQQYAKWQIGVGEKPNLHEWFKNYREDL